MGEFGSIARFLTFCFWPTMVLATSTDCSFGPPPPLLPLRAVRRRFSVSQEACRRTVTAEKGGLLNYTAPKYHAAAFCVATVEAKVTRRFRRVSLI